MISHLLSTICHVTTFLLAEIPEHVLGIVKPMSKVSASDCGVVRFTILQERAPTTLRLASGIFMCTTKQRNILSCVLYRLEYTSFTWINTSESITSFRFIPHTSCVVMC